MAAVSPGYRTNRPESYTSIRIPKAAHEELLKILDAGRLRWIDPPEPWQYSHRGGIWSGIMHLARGAAAARKKR